MKLKTLGRAVMALAASAGCILGMTSCSRTFTVGYFFVTGSQAITGVQAGQITTYKINNASGQLTRTTTTSSVGTNPIQALVSGGGNYLYVLNAGCGLPGGSVPCASGAPQGSQIDLFSIGGQGVLTHQQTFTSQGINTRNIAINGAFLYALDTFAPANSAGPQTVGAITAFSIDPNTGRLSLIQNNQQRDPNGLALPYFPVGTNPTWLAFGGSQAFIAEQGPATGATAADPPQAIFFYNQSSSTGQLTLTESTPTPTGATQLTYVYVTGATLYALDAGPPGSTGQILPYNVGGNGGLGSAITPKPNNGQGTSPVLPTRIIKESTHNFLWVANSGLNPSLGIPGSVITAYFITPNGQLTDANTGGSIISVGAAPSCIVEDPSSQYIYTANFNDSTISGYRINQNAGFLTMLQPHGGLPAAPGSPTWCAVSGTTF
jgi:6-phosphogluconolactonase (cycloisomerase 2 family)